MAKLTKTNGEKVCYQEAREHDSELYKFLKEVYRKNGIAHDIEEDELKELKSLISRDGEIQRRLRAYQNLSPVLDSDQKKAIEESTAKLIYSRLGKKKANYDLGEIIRVYLPKLGLGPLKMISGNGPKKEDPHGGIEQWLFIIEDECEAAKILCRAYERELLTKGPNPTPSQIKTFLEDKLKNER